MTLVSTRYGNEARAARIEVEVTKQVDKGCSLLCMHCVDRPVAPSMETTCRVAQDWLQKAESEPPDVEHMVTAQYMKQDQEGGQ